VLGQLAPEQPITALALAILPPPLQRRMFGPSFLTRRSLASLKVVLE
jgi:hypothetical protein